MSNSIDFYEKNAQDFYNDTVSVDMSELYHRFLPLVPKNGLILDAGCGSGRDAFAFKELGYRVTAFDASERLCELASATISEPVLCARFDEISWQGGFDAVWACASLLHVKQSELPASVLSLVKALKPGGVMYCSFKLGDQERVKGDRSFTDMTDQSFRALVDKLCPRADIEIWITNDQRPERDEQWLNAILKL